GEAAAPVPGRVLADRGARDRRAGVLDADPRAAATVGGCVLGERRVRDGERPAGAVEVEAAAPVGARVPRDRRVLDREVDRLIRLVVGRLDRATTVVGVVRGEDAVAYRDRRRVFDLHRAALARGAHGQGEAGDRDVHGGPAAVDLEDLDVGRAVVAGIAAHGERERTRPLDLDARVDVDRVVEEDGVAATGVEHDDVAVP